MKKSPIIIVLLTALFLSAAAVGAESPQKVLAGWKISPGTTAAEENGKAVLTAPNKKEGVIARYLSPKEKYIQFRVEKGVRFYITGKKFQLPPVEAKPGVYTIPATGSQQGMTSFNLRFMGGEFTFCDFRSSASPAANSVTVEKNGDEVVISMPVKEKPDSLSLTLYVIDSGKNWKFKGMWRQLDWPGVPARLTPEADGVYRARFKLPELAQDFSAPALTVAAAVTMAGADNLGLGNFYGFFPFEVKIKASKQQTTDAHLKIYDLGPANTPPQTGAVRTDKALTWTGLSALKGGARVSWLEPMITSWAEVSRGKTARAVLKVKPGKYRVAVGLGSTILPSYAAHNHQPASGCVKINGKVIFRRNSAEQDRDVLMRREPDENDNFYRVYFKDLMFFEPETEVEAADGKIRLEFIADPHKVMVLNYLVVYPADDTEAAQRLARIRTAREERYNQHLILDKPKQKPFPMKTPFAVFPRENPDDNVRPDTLPSETEKKSPLVLFGASDEKLSGTFFVRTGAKKIDGLTVKLTGLSGELYRIMYIHHSTPSERRAWIGASHMLPVADPVDLKPCYSYSWRIRLNGPAKPGKYRGSIEVTAGGHTEKLPVEVNIHPLKLPELNDHYIAMDGDGIVGPYAADLMRYARDELGCTTAHLRMPWPTSSKFELDGNGLPVKVISVAGYDAKRYEEWLDAFVKADFPVKTPWIGLMSIASRKEPFNQGPFKPFSEGYCKAVKLSHEFLRDHAQKKGLPGILVDFGGEMGVGMYVPPERTIQSAIRLYDMVNGMPGVRTSYRCNCYATVERFNGHLDIQGVRGKHSWRSSDRITDYGRKKHIYSYSVGGRYLNGYHSWAHGARGNLREYMIYDHEFYRHRPRMAGASTTHDQSVMSGVNKPLLTVRSESFRGSVVDRQYLRLLDNAIAQAPPSAARKKAEAFRDMLRNTCLKDTSSESNTTGSSPWLGMRLDLMRQAIVECVLNLQKNDASAMQEYRPVAGPAAVLKPEVPKIDPKKLPEEARPEFDDRYWAEIRTGTWESQGYQYDGCAWYRTVFDLNDLNSPRLVFEGVDEQAWVWLNGKFLGYHDGWDKPFSFPLDQVAVKGKNTLCVLVFDSAYQGGIWRPAKVVNGKLEQVLNRWKFILKPGKQDLNVFQLKDGPLAPAGSTKLDLSLLLYGFPDVKMTPGMEILLDGKKLPVEVIPYRKLDLAIPVAPLGKGAHRLILRSAGKDAMVYDFYGI